MKKIVLVFCFINLFCFNCYAEQQIVRVGENNVEVREVLFRDRAGKEEVIISRESYGQNRINQERVNAQANLDAIDAMTPQEYWTNARKAFVEHKLKLDVIQREMDKVE